MLRSCLFLLAGVYVLQLSSSVFESGHLAVLLLASIALGRRGRLPALLLCGATLFQCAAERQAAERLDPALGGESLLVLLQIVDFPRQRSAASSFIARPLDDRRLPARLRISWFEAPVTLRAGDTWQLQLRLKAPRASQNPGGSDHEAWLFRERIGATAYVVQGPRNHLLASPGPLRLLRLRTRIADRIGRLIRDPQQAAVLVALGVGTRHLISDRQWQQFALTGTSHLMAISGLHIGLAAAAAFLFLRCVAAGFLPRANHHLLATAGAVAVGCAYALLAGLAVPSQRASLMLLLAGFATLRRRGPLPAHVLALAALLLLASEPLATMQPGFILSFTAVAVLIWHACRRHGVAAGNGGAGRSWHAVSSLLRVQGMLFLGLFGLTALLFGRISLAAPLVNLLLVPLFSLVTVPCVLLGMLLDGPLQVLGDPLIRLAAGSVRLATALIGAVAEQRWAALPVPALDRILLASLLLPAAWVVLPRGWPCRALAWLAVGVVCLYRSPPPPPDCIDLTVLDVGQGLAAVVRATDLTLVYDTGLAFRGGGSSAGSVILPFLERHSLRRVDRLVISHADLDHAGGAADLVASMDVEQVYVGEALDGIESRPCRAGERWRHGRLQIATLHPASTSAASANAASCVLMLELGAHRLLLPGDIEADVERKLLDDGRLTRADVVVAPHHGSRTSSSSAFVRALLPALVIVPAGAGNRWGFPHPGVVARWEAAGARVLTTAASGAVTVRLCRRGGIVAVYQHRSDTQRPWRQP